MKTSEKSSLPQGEMTKAVKGNTIGPQGAGKCLLPEKKKPRRLIIRLKEEYSAFERANTPYCRPMYMYLDGEVPTDLTAPEIEVLLLFKA